MKGRRERAFDGGKVVNGMFIGISILFSSMRSWAKMVKNELLAPSSSRNWSAAAYRSSVASPVTSRFVSTLPVSPYT